MDIWRGDWWNAQTPLNAAIHYQNDDIVRLLLDYGANPDPRDMRTWAGRAGTGEAENFPFWYGDWDRTLHAALRYGTEQALEMVLDAGADINWHRGKEHGGWYGLGWPAHGNNLTQAKRLMDRGADLQQPQNHLAFVAAAERGHTAFVELMATHGAALESTNNQGRTALDRATREGHTDTVELLSELADIARRPQPERDCILHSRAQFIDAIIDGDADTLRDLLHQEPTLLNRKVAQVDLFGYAAKVGHQAVVDVLGEYGAPWTITAAAFLGRVEQVEAMIAAEPSLLKGAEPLIAAARTDQVPVIELLLDRGANINAQVPVRGWTALHEAVDQKSMNALEVLLSRGASVNLKDRWGQTPLKTNWPLTLEREKIRDLLIAHGAKR